MVDTFVSLEKLKIKNDEKINEIPNLFISSFLKPRGYILR